MFDGKTFLEHLQDVKIDFNYYCARLNQLQTMVGVPQEDEVHRTALIKGMASELGLLIKNVWLDAGGKS